MIRQIISCDICKSEKKQSNHWYVVYEQGGELRLSGWSSRQRTRPGARHLCGQSCVYKLVDDFMAQLFAMRGAGQESRETAATKCPPARAHIATDTSLTSHAAYEGVEEYARLIAPPEPEKLPAAAPASAGIVVPLNGSLRQAARIRRAEAWERERERESQEAEPKPDFVGRSAGRLL